MHFVRHYSRFFSFFSSTFFFLYVCCYQPVISTHGCHLQISSLHHTHKSPPKQLLFLFYCSHLSQVDEKKKNKKNYYLMSELIKACRSCICCPVCWPLLFLFSTFRWKEKENVSYINFSLRHAHESPTEKVCICVQKLPDWNLTEKVKR
jgi:hypothetical protein